MCDIRDTLILPCRHLCLCNSCADSLRYQANNCPICRAPFRALLQIRALQKATSQLPTIPQEVCQTVIEECCGSSIKLCIVITLRCCSPSPKSTPFIKEDRTLNVALKYLTIFRIYPNRKSLMPPKTGYAVLWWKLIRVTFDWWRTKSNFLLVYLTFEGLNVIKTVSMNQWPVWRNSRVNSTDEK